MKHVLSAFVALSLLLSISSVLAAESPKSAKVKKESEPAKATSSYSTVSESSLTGSIGSVDGNFVFGPGFQMEWPVILEGNQFAFGWQTGFYYSSTSGTVSGVKVKSKVWGLPIFATGKYLFQSGIDFLRPYLGFAFGMGIDRESGEVAIAGGIESRTETNLHFAMLIRPGLTLGESQRWFAELAVGELFTDFAILPTVGYHF
jgi:hypothetical protein